MVRKVMILAKLHIPSVLKPSFDLNLGKVKCTGKLDSFADCQVFIILNESKKV